SFLLVKLIRCLNIKNGAPFIIRQFVSNTTRKKPKELQKRPYFVREAQFAGYDLMLRFDRMNMNEQVITRFYSAFQKRDYETMQDCYDDKVIFYDPVFEDLVDDEVRLMWEILCKRATDLSIEFS